MNFIKKYILLLILGLGFLLRINGLNWDQGFHLHPDERFLTMVGLELKSPQTLLGYFDPQHSTLNPENVNFKFFVYGVFPLLLNKFLAVFFSNHDYLNFTLQGRFLSALFDTLTILFIYKAVKLFEEKFKISKKTKYLAAFLYAIAVLPIQLSHFFTVDTFLNLFVFASFYYALKFYFHENHKDSILSGVFLGLALASKVTAAFIIPLSIFLLVKNFSFKKMRYLPLIYFLGVTYLVLRLADPYIFQSSNFLNPTLSSNFIANLKILKSFDDPNAWFPPAVQWINKTPVLFSIVNLSVFGIGIPYFLALLVGLFNFSKKAKTLGWVILIWIGAFFLYQSTKFSQNMRYFLPLYPFFAILGAYGLSYLEEKNKSLKKILLILILIWPLAFQSIYINKHSRVTASHWIYENLPNNSTILAEHWDDALPLGVDTSKQFTIEQLPVFDPDSNNKWETMNRLLEDGDYYILSSNRGWGSITTVPKRYPKMSKFYEDLFAGKTNYEKIIEFNSFPAFRYLGIPIDFPDYWADESFTVYDHPQVMIFRKK